jgi:hypothetical protein
MNETEFNAGMRRAIRAHGLRVMHIRETDTPGVLDLMVYQGSPVGITLIIAWVELKLQGEELRPSQVNFIREHFDDGCPIYIMQLRRDGEVDVYRPEARDADVLTLIRSIPDYRQFNWRQFFIR